MKAIVDKGTCTGCGLCVTTCPTGSMTLIRKPVEIQPVVHETSRQTYLQLGRLRKKLNGWKILKILLRSKVDRLRVASGINDHYIKLKSTWK